MECIHFKVTYYSAGLPSVEYRNRDQNNHDIITHYKHHEYKILVEHLEIFGNNIEKHFS